MAPLAALVGLYLASAHDPSDAVRSGSTGADGSFAFEGLEHDVFVVRLQSAADPRVKLPLGTEAVAADCTAGDVHGLVLRGRRFVPDTSGPAWDPKPFGPR